MFNKLQFVKNGFTLSNKNMQEIKNGNFNFDGLRYNWFIKN